MAAKHHHVRQNYNPRAQKDCLKRSFLIENFFPDFGARPTGLETLLFGTLAKKLGNVLIIASYKHRGTTWWREVFNKQSTNRFLIPSDTEKKPWNYWEKNSGSAIKNAFHKSGGKFWSIIILGKKIMVLESLRFCEKSSGSPQTTTSMFFETTM